MHVILQQLEVRSDVSVELFVTLQIFDLQIYFLSQNLPIYRSPMRVPALRVIEQICYVPRPLCTRAGAPRCRKRGAAA